MKISHSKLLSLLSYDSNTGVFTHINNSRRPDLIGTVAGCLNDRGYRQIKLRPRTYRASHLAWFYVTREWPKVEIDHKNNDPGDDSFDNLREADSSENKRNVRKHKDNFSGYKGVRRSCSKVERWEALICHNYKIKYIGVYSTKEEAARAYDVEARILFGVFAKLNFPEEAV